MDFCSRGGKTAAGSGLLARRAGGGDVLSEKVVWQLIKRYNVLHSTIPI